MAKLALDGRRIWLVLVVGMLLGLPACAGSSEGAGATVGASAELAALERQVADQANRIAALETKVALPRATSGVATVAPTISRPTPTIVPAVAGLVSEGVSKGAAGAKVTITEYVDYL